MNGRVIMAVPASYPRPIVFHPIELADFVQTILESHLSPSKLVVCGSQEDFISLVADITTERRPHGSSVHDEEGPESSPRDSIYAQPASAVHPLLTPTLHQVNRAQTLTMAFCPGLESLRAFLSVHGLRANDAPSHIRTDGYECEQSTYTLKGRKIFRHPFLALVNLVSIHSGTPSFSAQGLGRTFASAVEAAHRASQHLVIVECTSQVPAARPLDLEINVDDVEVDEMEHAINDPWEQQIPILNVTTRNFRPGERGWIGRTVKVRDVAERWCTFVAPKEEHVLML